MSSFGSLVCSENHNAQGTATSSSWKHVRNLLGLRKKNGKVFSRYASEESTGKRRDRLPVSLAELGVTKNGTFTPETFLGFQFHSRYVWCAYGFDVDAPGRKITQAYGVRCSAFEVE